MITYGHSILRYVTNLHIFGLPEAAYDHVPASRRLFRVTAGCPGLYMDVAGYISYIYARMCKCQRLYMGGTSYIPPMLL
jgi:hypothetical protein